MPISLERLLLLETIFSLMGKKFLKREKNIYILVSI